MSRNGPLREKTKTDYITKISVFIEWAGNVSSDEFNNSLATKYMTILASKDIKCFGRSTNETIKVYFNPVSPVLKYAFKHDYSDRLLWFDLDFGGVGRPSRRLISLVSEVWKLFPPRDTMINKKSLKVHSLF